MATIGRWSLKVFLSLPDWSRAAMLKEGFGWGCRPEDPGAASSISWPRVVRLLPWWPNASSAGVSREQGEASWPFATEPQKTHS